MKAPILGVCAFVLGLFLLPVPAHATQYSVTIPSVASYPTTTIRFSAPAVLTGSRDLPAASITVNFGDPNFSAFPTGGRWITSARGTYFSFVCDRSSEPCMKATRGKGSYVYKLVGPAFAAPSSKGEFHLNWDVNPPGDVSYDTATVPEPSTVVLMLGGFLALVGVSCSRRLSARCPGR